MMTILLIRNLSVLVHNLLPTSMMIYRDYGYIILNSWISWLMLQKRKKVLMMFDESVDYMEEKKFKMIIVGKSVFSMLVIIDIVNEFNDIIRTITSSKTIILFIHTIDNHWFICLALSLICAKEPIDRNVTILIVDLFKVLNVFYYRMSHHG